MELRYDVTIEDLAAAGKFEERLWRGRVLRGPLVYGLRVLPLSATLVAILIGIDLVRDGLVTRGHVAVLVAVLVAFGSFTALWITLFSRGMAATRYRGPFPWPHRLVVDDDGLAFSNDRGATSLKWRNFVEVHELDKLIALVTDRGLCAFLPTRAFATDETRLEFIARVRAIAASNTAAAGTAAG